MKEIGGYFGLELDEKHEFHPNAIRLNTARNCLEYILKARAYRKIYVPYYCCDVILQPINRCKIDYEYYSIDSVFEPVFDKVLLKNEALLYINYFGLKQSAIEKLASKYGEQLIVDNSQAFFAERSENIDTFYSARKFFGVADGAYLYTNQKLDINLEQDLSYSRMIFLLKRLDLAAQDGYSDCKENEIKLNNNPIKGMSSITKKILKSIDYIKVASQRKKNYEYLDGKLANYNLLNLDSQNGEFVPMVYPFLIANGKELKKRLIDEHIYVPTYWPNITNTFLKEYRFEVFTAENLVPLPIDQRYNIADIEYVVNKVTLFLEASKALGCKMVSDQNRIYLRRLRIEDAQVSWKWRNDSEIWEYTGKKPDKYITLEIERTWLEKVLKESSSYRFAICSKDTDEYIGNIQITNIDWAEGEGEFHIFIGEKKYWNKGFGTDATKMMIKFARNGLRLKRLILYVDIRNISALRIYEKCGFQSIGTFGTKCKMILSLSN